MSTSVKRTSTYLFVLRIVRMLISVVSVTVTAKYYGVSLERDSWVLAYAVTTTIIMAVWGPLNEIFRTKFVYIKEQEGKEIALEKTSSLVGFVFLATLVIGLILLVFADELAPVLSSSISPQAIPIFTTLLILLLPNLLLTELAKLSISVFNAFDIFYIPEVVSIITGIIGIVINIIFAPIYGIYALVISTYVSAIILFSAILYYQKKANLLSIWKHLIRFDIKEAIVFITFSLPFFLPYFVGQLNFFGEKFLAGQLGQGQLSILDYSRQFISNLQSVLSSVLTTLMVPLLAKAYINKEKEKFVSIFNDNFIFGFGILTCAFAYLVGATEPLCDFFFNRGKVTPYELDIIINLTRLFSVSFIGVYFYIIFGMAMLASNQRKQYATLGVATQVIVFVFNYIGIVFIKSPYVFAFSYGIGHLLSSIIMMYFFKDLFKRSFIYSKVREFSGMIMPSIAIIILNSFVEMPSSILQLLLDSIVMVTILPFSAILLGYDVMRVFKK